MIGLPNPSLARSSVKTYEEATRYLESLIPYSGQKLESITYLLELLGNPQKKFKSAHVAGTSGKGSTAYLINDFLVRAGYTVGLHISPHLQVLTERMQVNNQYISERDFIGLVNNIKPLVDEVAKKGYPRPSYFETLVAMSFCYFASKNVGIAVVEVGLGGRLDATNVLTPLVSVITNISFDHTDILGKTLEKVAREKAGIIKKGIDVVSGVTQKNVLTLIQKECDKKHALLMSLRRDIVLKKISPLKFSLLVKGKTYRNLTLGLLGSYQMENAALAIGAVEVLKTHTIMVNEEAIKATLLYGRFAGRLEIVQKNPLVILDGAHNPAKMKALANSLKQMMPVQKFVSIVAIKKGKDAKVILRELLPITKQFIFTIFYRTTDQGANLCQDPEVLKNILKEYSPETPSTIQREIKKLPEEATLITGSLYLVGEMRNRWYPWEKVLEKRSAFV